MIRPNVIDISSHQENKCNFTSLFNQGVRGVIVKLTEGSENGSKYFNNFAPTQIANARSAGMVVSTYHYFLGVSIADAQAEADWYAKKAIELGLPKSTIMVCDVEDPSLIKDRSALTTFVNAFHQRMALHGFNRLDTYASASWFKDRLITPNLITKNIWNANYPSNPVTPDYPCGLWQFASDYRFDGHPFNLDANIDYNGFYTNGATAPSRPNPPAQTNTDGFTITRWYDEIGTFEPTEYCWIKYKPTVAEPECAHLVAGEKNVYDTVVFCDGHAWLKYTRGNGKRAYICYADSPDGKTFGRKYGSCN